MKRKFSFLLAVFMIFNIVISGFSNNFVSAKSSPKIDTKSSDVVANTADKKTTQSVSTTSTSTRGTPRTVEREKTDLDLSRLELYQFSLKQENMEIVNQSNDVDKKIVKANGKWKESTVFMMKIDKSKGKVYHKFTDPLKLKFTNAGTVNGKQVDVYVDILAVELNYQKGNDGNPDQSFDNPKKTAVPFLTVDENWGQKSIQIMDYIYPNHPNVQNDIEHAYNVSVATRVEYKYADGTPCELKVVMQPSDIDVVNPKTKVRERYWISGLESSADKLVMNNKSILREEKNGGWTYWENSTSQLTEGAFDEHNKTGFAVRSIDNTFKFSYTTAAFSGGLFGFYTELPANAPEKAVDKSEIPAEKDQQLIYTGTFTSPRPGVDIIGDIRSLKMSDTFDDRLDFQKLEVTFEGKKLKFGTDYNISQNGQTVVVEIINQELLKRPSQGKKYVIKYYTKTNNKIKSSGEDIKNRVTMIVDNVELHSNYVKTELLYKQTHEFRSKKTGYELPQKVKDLTPGMIENLKNGTVAKPTQPTQKFVTTPEGVWEFEGYDKEQETVNGADVHFIGYWTFTNHVKPKKDVYTGSDTTSIDGKVVKPGQELTYSITYTNTTGEEQDVTITDSIPKYTTYVQGSADNGGVEASGVITWNKKVAKGDSLTVTFKVKVNEDVNGKEITNVSKVKDGTNEFTTNETHNPTPTEPKKDVFDSSAPQVSIDGEIVKAGQELLYKVTYKNTTGKDQKVVIKDKIPEYTTYVEGSADNDGVYKDGEITWTKEKVAADETFEVTFKVKVKDNVSGEIIKNKADVLEGNNKFETNETTNPTSTKPKKDVFDSQNDQVSIDGQIVKAGQELLYKVTYKNTTGKEQKVEIKDKIPEYTTYVDGSASDGGVYKDGEITWTKEKVAADETFEVTFKVKVKDNVSGEIIKNKADVLEGNNKFETNETTNPTSTKPKKDVFDSQNDQVSIDGQIVKAGQELLYKVTYKNTTGKDQKVEIKDKIPEYTTYVDGSASDGGVYKDGEITWTKEKVAADETFEVTFKVKVKDNVSGEIIKNKADVLEGNNKFETNETTNPTSTKPKKDVFDSSAPQVSIDGEIVKAGQELLYKVTYKNTTGKDQKVEIKDKIPEYTTYVDGSASDGGVYKDGEITWTKEKVAADETFEVTFKVKVKDNVSGEIIKNKADVLEGNNKFETNETTNPTSTKPKKDVFDSQNDQVSIDGQIVKAGQELLYKVTYKNTTGKEQKVVIKDAIPEHTKYVEGSADNNGVYENGVITWTKEKVAPGETFEVTFKVKVDENVNGEVIKNKANVLEGNNNYETNETTNPTPKKPGKEIPRTGFGANTALYTALLGLSTVALGGFRIRYKKKNNK